MTTNDRDLFQTRLIDSNRLIRVFNEEEVVQECEGDELDDEWG